MTEDGIFDIVMIFVIMRMLATIFNKIDSLGLIGMFLLALVACVIWVLAKDWLVNQGIEL